MRHASKKSMIWWIRETNPQQAEGHPYSEVSDKSADNVKGEHGPIEALLLPYPQRLVAVRGIEPRFDG